jgi:hypothetical protein
MTTHTPRGQRRQARPRPRCPAPVPACVHQAAAPSGPARPVVAETCLLCGLVAPTLEEHARRPVIARNPC